MPREHDDDRSTSYPDELFGDPAARPEGPVTPCAPVIQPGRHGAASPRPPRDAASGDADCEIEREREETRRRTKI